MRGNGPELYRQARFANDNAEAAIRARKNAPEFLNGPPATYSTALIGLKFRTFNPN